MAKFCTRQTAIQFTPLFPMEKQLENPLFRPFSLEKFVVRPRNPIYETAC